MENATKALLIAGGVLIAILIISVLVVTLQKAGNVSKSYDKSVSQEEIKKFNVNFTKYLGQDLTIHQVVTICNFAYKDGTHKVKVNGSEDNPYTNDKIKENLDNKYIITINSYDGNGYITNILISERKILLNNKKILH